jgi:hypothetical protein
MLVFSHWEYVDEPCFWGGVTRSYRAVYVEGEIRRADSGLIGIQRETQRMNALKQKFDAEAAMLDSYARVARKKADLPELTHQRPPQQITYRLLVQVVPVR